MHLVLKSASPGCGSWALAIDKVELAARAMASVEASWVSLEMTGIENGCLCTMLDGFIMFCSGCYFGLLLRYLVANCIYYFAYFLILSVTVIRMVG